MSEKLLSCPFCGSSDCLIVVGSMGSRGECPCGVAVKFPIGSAQKTRDQWNTRAAAAGAWCTDTESIPVGACLILIKWKNVPCPSVSTWHTHEFNNSVQAWAPINLPKGEK